MRYLVPIIPNFLFKLSHPDEVDLSSISTTTTRPSSLESRTTRPHCYLVAPTDDYLGQGPSQGQGQGQQGRNNGGGRPWSTVAAESYSRGGSGRRRVICFRNTTSQERRQKVLRDKGLWYDTDDDDEDEDGDDQEYQDDGNTSLSSKTSGRLLFVA